MIESVPGDVVGGKQQPRMHTNSVLRKTFGVLAQYKGSLGSQPLPQSRVVLGVAWEIHS